MNEYRSFHQFPPLPDEFDEVDELCRVLGSAMVRPARVVQVCDRLVDPVLRYLELSLYPAVLRKVRVRISVSRLIDSAAPGLASCTYLNLEFHLSKI